jgi:hypothetical protein
MPNHPLLLCVHLHWHRQSLASSSLLTVGLLGLALLITLVVRVVLVR